jgi:hypothetical protein
MKTLEEINKTHVLLLTSEEIEQLDPKGQAWANKRQAQRYHELRMALEDACRVFDHYDLPEHALHYRRMLANQQLAEKA